MSDRARTTVVLETLSVVGGYVLAISLIHAEFFSKRFDSPALSLALAFSLFQCLAIVLLVILLFVRKAANQMRERRGQKLRPEILKRLAKHVTEGSQLTVLERLYRNHPYEVESSLLEFSASIRSGVRDRLAQLAIELNLVSRWEHQYASASADLRLRAIIRLAELCGPCPSVALSRALADKEESIRVEAARSLIQSGGRAEIERVFELAITQPLLVRAVLAEDLQPHALVLCEQAIPRALDSSNAGLVRTALELVGSWRKFLPISRFSVLLGHTDPEVRAAAFRILPYVTAKPEIESDIISALGGKDQGVRIAAAFAAGRMKVQSAVPLLSRSLREAGIELALAAAYALADMGAYGLKILEEEVSCPNQVAAAAALEALGRAKTEHDDYADLP